MKRPAACSSALSAAALSLLAATGAPAGDEPRPDRRVDALILLGGQDAGRYREETVLEPRQIRDTTAEDLVINRLGSLVQMRTQDVEVQDPHGRLTGGHYEITLSKSPMTTDLVVKDHTLMLRVSSAGKSYPRSLSFTGELLGPAGVRAALARARPGEPIRFQSFDAEVGAVAQTTLLPAGHEAVMIDGAAIDTLKLEERQEGSPGVTTLWVDAQGYTVRVLQDSPLGAIEIRRGRAAASLPGAILPAESFESTLAMSNIRLPHPRSLGQVTLEINARDSAGMQWPDLRGSTQRVLTKTPQSVVLEISRSLPGAYQDGEGPVPGKYLAANALLQSDDEGVKRIAAGLAAGERDPWKVALALQRWVNESMHFDAGIAVAPAAEVARDRHGTCVGYAVLLASLARVRHIPSRLVMGYVYEDRIWGGHAWVEVLIDGQWRALDAAEYAPATADAARIAVIRDSGQSGMVEDIGELARLFSKVDIRVRAYRLGDLGVEVPPLAAAYTLEAGRYINPWLGLTVLKPQGAQFTDLDTHWPGPPAVVSVEQGEATVRILYMSTDAAGGSAPAMVAKLLDEASAVRQPITWNGLPASRGAAGDEEVLAAVDGDMAWGVLASGPGSHALLESVLPGITVRAAAL